MLSKILTSKDTTTQQIYQLYANYATTIIKHRM